MLKLMLFMVSILYSLSPTEGDGDAGATCETTCRYLDYAKDAECTDRGLSTVPSGCRAALNFDITFNNLTSLAVNALQGFFQLRYIHLEENQITVIEAGAFLPVKGTLRMLNISRNQITQLVHGTFVNMTRLEYLLMSDNLISHLSSRAFEGMTRLSKLYLGNNQISTLDLTIFNEMPMLTELNLRDNKLQTFDISFLDTLPFMRKIFAHRNALTEVTGTVSNHHYRVILLNFSANNISSFDCSNLQNLESLRNVYLGSNSLHTINNCHNHHQLSVLRMTENPFHCDCHVRALQQWLQQHPDSPSPACSTPEDVRGFEVRDLELDCPENDDLIATTHQALLDGFHEEGTTLQIDLPQNVETIMATQKVLDIPEMGGHGHLITKIRKIQNELVLENNQLQNESGFFRMDGSVMADPKLLVVLVAISVLFVVVVCLLIIVVKNYCRIPHSDENVEKKADWSNTQYNHQSDAEIEEGNIANENMSNGCHHYEDIKERKRQSAPLVPRQLSVDTDSSETNMLPPSPDSGVCPYNNSTWESDENSCHNEEYNYFDSRGSTISPYEDNRHFTFVPRQEGLYSCSLSSYPGSLYSNTDTDCTGQSYSPCPPPNILLSTVGDTSPYVPHCTV